VTNHETPAIPTGLPTRYPNRIPSVIGEVEARARKPESIAIPALASANSGTTT
jgi:hypothetical protein